MSDVHVGVPRGPAPPPRAGPSDRGNQALAGGAAAHAAAFERVADTLLSPSSQAPLTLALASPHGALLGAVARGLVTAAALANIPMAFDSAAGRDGRGMPATRQPPPARTPRIVLLDDGVVDEARIARLAAPHGSGPDLLVWVMGRRSPPSLRELYLLGLWAWGRAPARVRCLLPGATADRGAAVGAVSAAMAAAALPVGFEVLVFPEQEAPSGVDVLGQLLRSTLAAAHRLAGRGAVPG